MLDDWRIVGVVLPVLLIVWVTRRFWGRPHGPRSTPVRRGGVGPGAAGAFYEMLNEDRRRAIEIIVEQRAEKRDAEDADGNLPELERPKK
jgi:hypothetical protein